MTFINNKANLEVEVGHSQAQLRDLTMLKTLSPTEATKNPMVNLHVNFEGLEDKGEQELEVEQETHQEEASLSNIFMHQIELSLIEDYKTL